MLQSLGVLVYSPPLEYAIRDKREIASGYSWEVQLRGCSIWYERPIQRSILASQTDRGFANRPRAVELIRREILRLHPEALEINAVLIDFFLYDLAKERETSGKFFCSIVSIAQFTLASVGSLVQFESCHVAIVLFGASTRFVGRETRQPRDCVQPPGLRSGLLCDTS